MISDDEKLYEILLIKLHKFISWEQDECDAADEIRDELYDLSVKIPDEKIKTLHNLSGDLYMLDKNMNHKNTEITKDADKLLAKSIDNNDWENVLFYLRDPVVCSSMTRFKIAEIMSKAYENLGLHYAAKIFDEFSKSEMK